jgi:hypothetical protein
MCETTHKISDSLQIASTIYLPVCAIPHTTKRLNKAPKDPSANPYSALLKITIKNLLGYAVVIAMGPSQIAQYMP